MRKLHRFRECTGYCRFSDGFVSRRFFRHGRVYEFPKATELFSIGLRQQLGYRRNLFILRTSRRLHEIIEQQRSYSHEQVKLIAPRYCMVVKTPFPGLKKTTLVALRICISKFLNAAKPAWTTEEAVNAVSSLLRPCM